MLCETKRDVSELKWSSYCVDYMIFVFKVLTWTVNLGDICSIWDPFMVLRVINHNSVLESKGSIRIELKRALFGFNIGLPSWIVKYIELYYLWAIVVFTYETKAFKFSTSFIICGKERFSHIVNIPIIKNLNPRLSEILWQKLSLSLSLACMA